MTEQTVDEVVGLIAKSITGKSINTDNVIKTSWPITVDDFKCTFIDTPEQLKAIETWLESKGNLSDEVKVGCMSQRFKIEIGLMSAITTVIIYDLLEGNSLDLTDWDNF